jgi:hypothetical protein
LEYLVRFTTAEGREGNHAAATLHDALRFVERLRNSEEVSDVRVFRMHEVPIEFRTYYKVELKAGEPGEAPAADGDNGHVTLPEQPDTALRSR